MATRDDAKRFLVGLLPKGTTDWLDVESAVSNLGQLFYAHGGGWKTYGLDLIDTLRRELNPAAMEQKIPDWEAALGLSETPIAKYGTTAQRRNAVLAWLRQSGSFSLPDIRAVVQPYFLYANSSNIAIVETSRSALTTLHTRTSSTIVTITAGNSSYQDFTVLDDGDAAPGLRVVLNWTGTISTTTTVLLVSNAGVKFWSHEDFGTGAALAQDVTLWAPELTGVGFPVGGTWRIYVFSGANDVTINSWSLIVEGVGVLYDGYTPPNRIGQGLGAAMYEFAVVAQEDLLGTGYDLVGAQRALNRIKPAHVNCTIVWRATGAGAAYAIPDTRSATPDAAIPGS